MKIFIFSHYCFTFVVRSLLPSESQFPFFPIRCHLLGQHRKLTLHVLFMEAVLLKNTKVVQDGSCLIFCATPICTPTHPHNEGQCLKCTACKSSFTDLVVFIMLRANAVLRKLSQHLALLKFSSYQQDVQLIQSIHS